MPIEDKKTEALKTIALYVLPVFTINGKKYVRAELASFLVQTAKEALS